jgi:hypothetical protein
MGGAWSRAALLAATLTAAVFTAALAAVVTSPLPRLAATNSRVVASGAELVVPPGQARCERGQFIPAETATLRVFAGSATEPTGEPLRFSIAKADDLVSRQRVEGGYPLGALNVPVDPPDRNLSNGEICIENLGSLPMAFAGNRTPLGAEVPGGVVDLDEEIRIDLFRSDEESLWVLAPELARRFAVFKPSFTGPWTMWAVLVVAGGAVTTAALVASREPSPLAQESREDEP